VRIGRYRVVGRLATGGMAEILIGALDGAEGFSKAVVIKRVLSRWARRRDFRTMFVDEARIVSGIRHPNVVSVLELGDDGDALYLVMEYLEGEPLHVVVRRFAECGLRVAPAIAAHVVAEACAGLHAAHEHTDADGSPRGVVHRDVSPHNVFVSYDGTIRVIDFGVAKAENRETKTETGTIKGKFGYMAPEQVGGESVDRRTDLFALGVILWELLTGKRLFQRSNHLETVKATCFEPIASPREIDPSIPPALDRVAMRALERDREERFQNAAEMRRELVAAIRAIAPDAVPGDDLAELMRATFQERIEEKRDMLRAIAAGGVANVPKADVLDDEDGGSIERSAITARTISEAGPARRPWLAIGIAAVILLAIAGGSIGAFVAFDTREPVTPAAPPVDEWTERTDTVEAAPVPEPRAEAATITVRVETTPPGATVRIDGEPRGPTPIALDVPAGDTELAIRIEKDGYRPEDVRVVGAISTSASISTARRAARESAHARSRRRWKARASSESTERGRTTRERARVRPSPSCGDRGRRASGCRRIADTRALLGQRRRWHRGCPVGLHAKPRRHRSAGSHGMCSRRRLAAIAELGLRPRVHTGRLVARL
jgi:serine/threonine-protein kinase